MSFWPGRRSIRYIYGYTDSPIIRGIWRTRNDVRAYVHKQIVIDNVRWREHRYPGSMVKYRAEIWSSINSHIFLY